MRRFSAALMLVALALAVALGISAPFREFIRSHLPEFAQDAGATATRSGDKGGSGAISVDVATAGRATLPIIERTYGIVTSPAVVAINAQVASQIKEIHVEEGQIVKAGDLLVVLDDRLLQAQLAKDQAVLAKDQALEVSLAADLDRAKDLANKGFGTKQTYDEALAAQKAGQATVIADQAAIKADQAQLEYTRIAAPIGGRLGAIQVAVGDLAGAGGSAGTSSSLMTITQLQPIKVAFKLPEFILPKVTEAIQAGKTVPVRVLQSGTSTELESGNLDFIDAAVDTGSGTIAMSATVGNGQLSLWPGQYADVEIEYGTLVDAITIPAVAVQQGQSGPYVWLVRDGKTVAARPVVVARNEGDKAAISSGLSAGDQVVVEGQLRLKDDAAVKIASSRQKQP
jgi:membrane fusion protein, multidrug efflux system